MFFHQIETDITHRTSADIPCPTSMAVAFSDRKQRTFSTSVPCVVFHPFRRDIGGVSQFVQSVFFLVVDFHVLRSAESVAPPATPIASSSAASPVASSTAAAIASAISRRILPPLMLKIVFAFAVFVLGFVAGTTAWIRGWRVGMEKGAGGRLEIWLNYHRDIYRLCVTFRCNNL